MKSTSDGRDGVALCEFAVGVGDGRKDPLAVRPEAEERAEAKADHVGRDVVSEWAGEAERVVAEPEAAERDAHRDAVEHDEKHVFAGDGVSSAAVTEGPKAVADVGDSGGNDDADDLGGQRFVIEWTSAPSKKQNIEQTDVNDECDQADDAKLGNLSEQFLESSPQGTQSCHR